MTAIQKDSPGAGDVHVDGTDWKSKAPHARKPDAVAKTFERSCLVKADTSHGLVFGFAIVSKKAGEDYYDTQGDHIPEDAMIKAAADFMRNSRLTKEMHKGDPDGDVVFAMPITDDIRKAILESDETGLLIGMAPGPDALAKFRDGTYTGFSIGGSRLKDEAA